MSFIFRGTRGDVESGFSEFVPERRSVRIHGGRPVNTNSMAFLITVLLLFMILNSHQMPSNFLLWIGLGVFFMATTLRMYATCQQLQAQAQAQAEATSNRLFGGTELRVHVPPSMTFATRGRLHGLRLQLALLDREFDDLDYDALRALDSDLSPGTPSMTEEEINALPVHKYKGRHDLGPGKLPNDNTTVQHSSSTRYDMEKEQVSAKSETSLKKTEEDLTCSICLEQVNAGELIRSLPCLHQFHTNCIDTWLRQQGKCPICKFRAYTRWIEGTDVSPVGPHMV